jgi:ActR/RegA family two-component response regulator
LVVDDDRVFLDECARVLRSRVVFTTTSSVEALELVRTKNVELALVDLWLGDDSFEPTYASAKRAHNNTWGIDVIRELRANHPALQIVMFTAGFSRAFAAAAREAGANATVPKFLGAEKIVAIAEAGMLETETEDAPMSLARNEYEYIAKVYMDNLRNASQTARVLGIPRSTLYRKLRKPPPRR